MEEAAEPTHNAQQQAQLLVLYKLSTEMQASFSRSNFFGMSTTFITM
jgi:hypothetical protein